MEYTSNEYNKTGRCQYVIGWIENLWDLDRLCPKTSFTLVPTQFPSLGLNALANSGHVKNGKVYCLGAHIQVNGHILLVLTHIQCFRVEWKLDC